MVANPTSRLEQFTERDWVGTLGIHPWPCHSSYGRGPAPYVVPAPADGEDVRWSDRWKVTELDRRSAARVSPSEMKAKPLLRLARRHGPPRRGLRPSGNEVDLQAAPVTARTSLSGFARRAAAEAQVLEASVLDVAAVAEAHHALFEPDRYESIALPPGPGRHYSTFVSKLLLDGLPIASEGFDLVLCTKVLEEAPEPQPMMIELARILTAEGLLYLAAPLIVPEPSPQRPRHRFGLNYLLEAAGFTIEDLMPVERSRCYAVVARKRRRANPERRRAQY